MSQSTGPQPAPSPSPVALAAPGEPFWAKPSLGAITLLLFVIALALAVVLKNQSALELLIGAVIANASTVINYYFGSSASSDHKTSLIAQQGTQP